MRCELRGIAWPLAGGEGARHARAGAGSRRSQPPRAAPCCARGSPWPGSERRRSTLRQVGKFPPPVSRRLFSISVSDTRRPVRELAETGSWTAGRRSACPAARGQTDQGDSLLLLEEDPTATIDLPRQALGWRYITLQVANMAGRECKGRATNAALISSLPPHTPVLIYQYGLRERSLRGVLPRGDRLLK
jgi:hypothetical protein